MKLFLLFILLCASTHLFSQTKEETEILNISKKIFNWEVENKIDSVEKIFNEKLVVIGTDGNIQNKTAYINRLKSGAFTHDSITVEENAATITSNTAIVMGKGKFNVTSSSKKIFAASFVYRSFYKIKQ